MFEGFETRMIEGAGADIFCRTKGEGPPLLLLHGYPQTGAMWAGVADAFAERFRVVVPDLRGYGRSSVPESQGGEAYSKRVMAADMVAVMAALGHERFHLAGHDRGGRVAYRLALDHPGLVERLAVLDIVPTSEMWARMGPKEAMKTYHWPFLAQPFPMPETLIAADPIAYLDHTIASWTQAKSLSAFTPTAMADYRASFAQAERIHAACEDYRAGWFIDRPLDEADHAAGRRIAAPTLVLWGEDGIPATGETLLDIWAPWCVSVEGQAVDGGHFVVEEAREKTLSALLGFFSAVRGERGEAP